MRGSWSIVSTHRCCSIVASGSSSVNHDQTCDQGRGVDRLGGWAPANCDFRQVVSCSKTSQVATSMGSRATLQLQTFSEVSFFSSKMIIWIHLVTLRKPVIWGSPWQEPVVKPGTLRPSPLPLTYPSKPSLSMRCCVNNFRSRTTSSSRLALCGPRPSSSGAAAACCFNEALEAECMGVV